MSKNDQPIPVIVTLWLIAYLLMLLIIVKDNKIFFSEEFLMMHIMGISSLYLVISKIVQRKLTKKPLLKNLMEWKL